MARFDRPWERLTGAIAIVVGQRKVLQRVGSVDARSRNLDLAGLGHAFVFWGFLVLLPELPYLHLHVGSIWHAFPELLLTDNRRKGLQHLPGPVRGPHPRHTWRGCWYAGGRPGPIA